METLMLQFAGTSSHYRRSRCGRYTVAKVRLRGEFGYEAFRLPNGDGYPVLLARADDFETAIRACEEDANQSGHSTDGGGMPCL
ncbi:MAG: hypothetical protein QJR02_07305 [Sinobacteraceae bacterium]|nr:hypothetical protein [Nevskiaceae bacterium]